MWEVDFARDAINDECECKESMKETQFHVVVIEFGVAKGATPIEALNGLPECYTDLVRHAPDVYLLSLHYEP